MATKAEREKKIADEYRKEFSNLSDGDILDFTLSVNGSSFVTLTEHVKGAVQTFKLNQPF